MKICPTCRKAYADDNLNFCLEDGTILTQAASEPPPTVMMSHPRPTDPAASFPTQNQGIQSSYGNAPNYSMQHPPKKSKAWLWIVGIVGILLLLCGGGFVGLVLIGMNADRNQGGNNSTFPTNNRSTPTPSPGASPFSSTTTPPSGDVTPIDVSMFVDDTGAYGTTEMSGDELMMAAKQKGYYFVLVATENYSTLDSTARVTVRNVDNVDSRLGYGLVFHSDKRPLTDGYAFLIDTKKKRYRVVRHSTRAETAIVSWRVSTAIKDGSQENVLEVRDKGSDLEFYINDQMVTTSKDAFTGSTGVPGLYSGDGTKVGFKKMEIIK